MSEERRQYGDLARKLDAVHDNVTTMIARQEALFTTIARHEKSLYDDTFGAVPNMQRIRTGLKLFQWVAGTAFGAGLINLWRSISH